MTIIFQDGNRFWIEHHTVVHTNIADATSSVLNFNFDRAGTVIGLSLAPSNSLSALPVNISLRTAANGIITLPLANQTALQSRFRNNSGGAASTTNHILVYMRGRGS